MKLKTRISFVLAALLLTTSISINDMIAEDLITLKTIIQDTKKTETVESPKMIQWSVLAPDNGKPFNDPFAKLTQDQLSDLSYVVRIQRLIEDGKIKADGVDAKEVTRLARKLKREGVDIGWLMAQRQRVQQIRDQQVQSLSKSIAKSLGDKKITLSGYVIPIRRNQGRWTEFFLVPTSATCSNEASPPRLQVVFVSIKQGIELPAHKNIPARVTGTVKARATTKTTRNGIGIITIQAAYAMFSPEIKIYSNQTQAENLLKM